MASSQHAYPVSGLACDPSANSLSRRNFLRAGAAAGGGLMLDLVLPAANAAANDATAFVPNAFIRIGTDGEVVLISPERFVPNGGRLF